MISGVIIAGLYIFGTLGILVIIPQEEISIITGAFEAVTTVASRFGLAFLGSIIALMYTFSNIGGTGAWLAGSARIPFVAGIDRHLPKAFGKLHPRWGTPHVALLVQGIVATIFLFAGFLEGTVKGAYLLLLDMTIIVYFIPYLYLFASLFILGKEPGDAETITIPGGKFGRWFAATFGLASAAVAIVLALLPPRDAENVAAFELKVGGGALAFLLVGALIYILQPKRTSNEC